MPLAEGEPADDELAELLAAAPRGANVLRLAVAAAIATGRDESDHAGPGRPGGAAHRCRQVRDLPDTGEPAPRADRRDLAAARVCSTTRSRRSTHATWRPEFRAVRISSDETPRQQAGGARRDPRRARPSSCSSRRSSSQPGSDGRGARAATGAGGDRRGALHLGVGARLPARLPRAGSPHPGAWAGRRWSR